MCADKNSGWDFKTKFTALFESCPDAVYLQTPEGKIIDCNTAAVDVTGYTKEELLQCEAKDLFQDDLVTYIPSILENEHCESGFTMNNLCRKKNGDSFPVEVALRPFRSGDNSYIFVIAHDNSALKNAGEEIKKLEQQLQQAQKMELVGQLAGGITHYYNNIFTGIIGTLNVVQRGVSEEVLPLLKRAEKAANLASGFTRRMLAFCRESPGVMEPTDVEEVISDAVDFARVTFGRHIHITVKKQGTPGMVLADPVSLHHVLLTLLNNACNALHEKQKSVSWEPKLAITVETKNVRIDNTYIKSHPEARRGRFVRVSVSDTGCGMDSETQKRVFEPFFTTKDAGKGTGLGLASANSMIQQYDGWFELSSEPGKGSTFAFYLPATTFNKTVAPQEDVTDLPRGTEMILLVDDNEMIRTLGTMTLERQGYTVLTAATGEECLRLFMKKLKAVKLLILDLVLPVLSGREVLEKIRRIDPDVKVIILSGYDFESNRESFAELKADEYILKPFNITDLVMAVRDVLDRRQK